MEVINNAVPILIRVNARICKGEIFYPSNEYKTISKVRKKNSKTVFVDMT